MSCLTFVLLLLIYSVISVHCQLTGGVMGQNPNNPVYMEIAWKAVENVNEACNDGQLLMIPVKVVKAQTQVVAGINYFLEILFGESTCKKGQIAADAISPANCPVKQDGKRALYKIELWEKAWENFEQITVKKIRDVAAGENI